MIKDRKMTPLLKAQIKTQKDRIMCCGIKALLAHNIMLTSTGTMYSKRFTPLVK